MSSRETLMRPSVALQRTAAGLLLVAGALYLVRFVQRGWVPLDEGMIGQAAERVLSGGLPHVDYEEPYPGALSYLYALVFQVAGIDSVNLRWTVFLAAVAALAVIYILLRRYLPPVSAALTTWVALVWTFPNYFSSLPSWWILFCALLCLWAIVRFLESERLLYAALAGLAAGVAFCIKQTGLYLMPPMTMSLLLAGALPGTASGAGVERFVRGGIAVAGFTFVIVITRLHAGSGEVAYLIAPLAATCVTFYLCDRWRTGTGGLNYQAALVGIGAAVVPVLLLVAPHILAGQLGAFLNGVFVLPQKRLEFTLLPMRPATQLVAGIVGLVWVLWAPRTLSQKERRVASGLRWGIALALPILALRSTFSYAMIWEAARGAAALLPFIVLYTLTGNRMPVTRDRQVLFAVTGMLAWTSLSQYPFAAPIYFCYVAPLALIAGVVLVHSAETGPRFSDWPTTAIALLFGILSMNRGYVWNVGSNHEVHDLSTPLGLERAHLYVDEYDAGVFQRVAALVREHRGSRGLMAGPDTPDVYYLAGEVSRSGRLFDFFSGQQADHDKQILAEWRGADIIVLFHGRRFSPPLSDALVARLRQEFPKGESLPPFEVRWR